MDTILEALKNLKKLHEAEADAEDDWDEDTLGDAIDDDCVYDSRGYDENGYSREYRKLMRRLNRLQANEYEEFKNKYDNGEATIADVNKLFEAYRLAGTDSNDLPLEFRARILPSFIRSHQNDPEISEFFTRACANLDSMVDDTESLIEECHQFQSSMQSPDTEEERRRLLMQHGPDIEDYQRQINRLAANILDYRGEDEYGSVCSPYFYWQVLRTLGGSTDEPDTYWGKRDAIYRKLMQLSNSLAVLIAVYKTELQLHPIQEDVNTDIDDSDDIDDSEDDWAEEDLGYPELELIIDALKHKYGDDTLNDPEQLEHVIALELGFYEGPSYGADPVRSYHDFLDAIRTLSSNKNLTVDEYVTAYRLYSICQPCYADRNKHPSYFNNQERMATRGLRKHAKDPEVVTFINDSWNEVERIAEYHRQAINKYRDIYLNLQARGFGQVPVASLPADQAEELSKYYKEISDIARDFPSYSYQFGKLSDQYMSKYGHLFNCPDNAMMSSILSFFLLTINPNAQDQIYKYRDELKNLYWCFSDMLKGQPARKPLPNAIN